MRRRLFAVVLTLASLAGACAGDDSRRAADGTSTSSSTTTTTAAPATAAPAAPTTTAAPAAGGPACPAVPARNQPPPNRPRYVLRVNVRPSERVADGEVTVRFTPDLPTDRLVFRLWPNGPRPAQGGSKLTVPQVRVGGHPVPARQETPTTLVVPLSAPLAAGRTIEASVPWSLTLPGSVPDRISREGDAVRLGSFFPILSWEPGVGWATEPPTSGFAEASVAPPADFTATVTVPEGLSVLATGVPDGSGRWVAQGVPDFALTVGRFITVSATVNAPNPVQVTVGAHNGIVRPQPYLDKVKRVLADFGNRFGPYPWPTYSLAITPNLPGGIEYPMHVMQGPFTSGRTTSHEVGHMWFYGLVVNNQGRDPWLDEGLATYAEARFEGNIESIKARSVPSSGRGRTGEPMTFWEPRQSVYFRSVYQQGAQAIAALGPPDLVDCALRHYVARHAFRVARPPDLVAAVSTVFPNAREVMARYGIKV